jgi:hypothetical protein
MIQKSTIFTTILSCKKVLLVTTILRVKKCHFHYDMQKIKYGQQKNTDEGRLWTRNFLKTYGVTSILQTDNHGEGTFE